MPLQRWLVGLYLWCIPVGVVSYVTQPQYWQWNPAIPTLRDLILANSLGFAWLILYQIVFGWPKIRED